MVICDIQNSVRIRDDAGKSKELQVFEDKIMGGNLLNDFKLLTEYLEQQLWRIYSENEEPNSGDKSPMDIPHIELYK